jgi:hypothetical protein
MGVVTDLVAAKDMLVGDAERLHVLLDLAPTVSVGFFQSAVPADADIVARYLFVEAATFPAHFLGSRGHVETLPTADATLDVRRNGVSIGTILIATDGEVTFETAGGTDQAFGVGDRLDVVGQSPPDDTMALITVTLLAYKD